MDEKHDVIITLIDGNWDEISFIEIDGIACDNNFYIITQPV